MLRSIVVSFLLVLPFFGWSQCPPAQLPGFHIVQKGETLYYLSRLYNVTVDQLCQWNSIQKTDVIKLCTQLRVSSDAADQPSIGTASGQRLGVPQQGNIHVVSQGETAEGLAELYGYTAQRFRRFNNLKPGEAVAPGRVLYSSDCQCPDPLAANPNAVVGYDVAQPAIKSNGGSGVSGKEDPFSQGTPQPAQPAAVATQATTAETEEALLKKIESSGPANELPAQDASAKKVSAPKAVAPFMSAAEVDMVNEINLVRFDPPAYVPFVEAYLEKIKGGPASGAIETCQELIAELKRTAPMATLEPMECIYRAAKLHGQEQAPKGTVDHVGKNGSYPWDRVREACPSLTDGNENLVGGVSNVRESVILLLVDHGISNRGHRRTLLDPAWRFVGCYNVGKVGRYENYWIQNFGK